MADNVRLLHFHRKESGHGYEREYIILVEEGDDTPAEDHCIPGYTLESETEIMSADMSDLPGTLPYSTTLMREH